MNMEIEKLEFDIVNLSENGLVEFNACLNNLIKASQNNGVSSIKYLIVRSRDHVVS